MNWTVLILVGLLLALLVGFLVFRNFKDEKEFERKMNNDLPKPADNGDDIDAAEKIH